MTLEDIRAARKKKLEEIKRSGLQPYPARSGRTHAIKKALESFNELKEQNAALTLVGRVFSFREHGGLVFGELRDGTGSIQFVLKKDVLGDDYQMIQDVSDVGDVFQFTGILFETKKGEKTIEVRKWAILAKSLRPLPEKWHGLMDTEERLRRRYLDLIMNSDVQQLFSKKGHFWQATREFLLAQGFQEVETPVLEPIIGGADAEPFTTHMRTLDIDLYLRISPELHLKRLLIGGFEKVFELGRIFRNEGIDREHLQDYTQVEIYWAYADYKKMMQLAELMTKEVILKTIGSLRHHNQGQEINWSGSWPEIDYYEVFKKETALDLSNVSLNDLKAYAKRENLDVEKHLGKGRLIDILFKKKVRPTLRGPIFLVLPPVEIEPLAKRSDVHPDRVERFQIVAGGTELGKGFSELNDPIDQRTRFEEQMDLRRKGDKEAQMLDAEYIEALEYGMPPAAGFAYSERLFAFIMDKPVREAVLFPIMKPRP